MVSTSFTFRYSQKPKENYHLPHKWNYISGTNIIVENENNVKTQISKSNLYPTSSNVPDWIAYDRKVCAKKKKFKLNGSSNLIC